LNPQDALKLLGSVFAFKIIEYLAAGLHVITTPRGAIESELETGITYIPGNAPDVIASGLTRVISKRHYERTAAGAAMQAYGPDAVSRLLNTLITDTMSGVPTVKDLSLVGAV
jgi:hypothetical protein